MKHKQFFSLIIISIFCLIANIKQPFSKSSGTFIEGKVTTKFLQFEEVLSSNDVYLHYYNEAKEVLLNNNIEIPYTYDEFLEKFYLHEYPINEFVQYFVDIIIENPKLFEYIKNEKNQISTLSTSLDSEDADYVLNFNDNPSTLPANYFKRAPIYNTYSIAPYDYSKIKPGDIIFEKNSLFGIGHTAIVTDTNKNSAYGNVILTIDAIGSGVKYCLLDNKRISDFDVRVLRYHDLSTSDRQDIVDFLRGQVGKNYNLDPYRQNLSYYSTERYCSELCHAAYRSVNIFIGMRKTTEHDAYFNLGCLPFYIYQCYDLYQINPLQGNFVDIQLRAGERWQIKVYNNTSSTLPIYYNKKMCFENDAKSWSGLSDTASFTLAKNASQIVTISENLWATDIAFSTLGGGKRKITYAHDLSDSPYSLNVLYA